MAAMILDCEGRGSTLLPVIGTLPTRWRDRFLSRKFGLDRLRQA
jgi:hypothetical protein